MKSCTSSFQEKFMYFLLIFTPIIDLLNGLFCYKLNLISQISPGQIIRMLILVILIFLFIRQKNSNLIILAYLVSAFIFQEIILYFNAGINFNADLLFISKIWFNLLLIILFRQYYLKREINEEKIINSIVNAANIIGWVIIVSKLLNIGVQSYGDAGYKGLFMGLNDITAVLTISMPFSLYKIIYSPKKVKNTIKFLVILVSLFMVGTKTGIVVTIALIGYYVFFGMKGKHKWIKRILIIILIMILGFIFLKYFYEEYKNTILKRQLYFIEKLDAVSYILSGRNELAAIAFEYWKTQWYFPIIGVGFTQGDAFISSFIANHGMIEMDFFDIMYFYGISVSGIFIYILMPAFLKSIKEIFIERNIKTRTFYISFFIGIIISFLGGHVILSPLAGVYFAIVFICSDKLMRCK